MKKNNKLMLLALTAGLGIFGGIATATAQTCQALHGEKSEISVRSTSRQFPPGTEDETTSELKQENLIRMDEKAKLICSGRAFCIDQSSIRHEVKVIDHFVTLMHVETSALVNCFN